MAYAPLETGSFNYKYFWKDIQCDIEAPFICKHNPDFFGFHKLSNLVLDVSVDVKLSSMSLSTCLAICTAQEDSISISFVLKDRCICAKGKIFFKAVQRNFAMHTQVSIIRNTYVQMQDRTVEFYSVSVGIHLTFTSLNILK